MRGTRSPCCACTRSGEPTAVAPRKPMNSLRLMSALTCWIRYYIGSNECFDPGFRGTMFQFGLTHKEVRGRRLPQEQRNRDLGIIRPPERAFPIIETYFSPYLSSEPFMLARAAPATWRSASG